MCFFLAPAAVAAGGVAAGAAGTAGAATATAAALSAAQIASLALTAVGAVAGAYGMYRTSQAQQSQANAQAKIAGNNQKIAEMQAQDALRRGGEADIAKRREYAQILGRQRAQLAGSGVDLSEGSALDMLNDTAMFESIDSGRIRENARREAWGFRTQGSNYAAEASMYRSAASGYNPFMSAGTSLLSGAGEVADRWLRYKQDNWLVSQSQAGAPA